jgi:hypothetical protein
VLDGHLEGVELAAGLVAQLDPPVVCADAPELPDVADVLETKAKAEGGRAVLARLVLVPTCLVHVSHTGSEGGREENLPC